MGTIEGQLKKEDLSATRSLVRTTLLWLTVIRMVLRGKMEACARKGSLIFNQNRGATKKGMKEIRGGCLGLLVFFKREGEDGELWTARGEDRATAGGNIERLVLFG